MRKKRVIDCRERVIIDKPLQAVNKQAVIVTSPASKDSYVAPSFAQNETRTEISWDGVDRNAPPPHGTMDHRGWTYGDLLVCGFAHCRTEKGRWCNKAPSDERWRRTHATFSNKRWKANRINLWWCVCKVCKTPFGPISTQALGRIERGITGNPCRVCNPMPPRSASQARPGATNRPSDVS